MTNQNYTKSASFNNAVNIVWWREQLKAGTLLEYAYNPKLLFSDVSVDDWHILCSITNPNDVNTILKFQKELEDLIEFRRHPNKNDKICFRIIEQHKKEVTIEQNQKTEDIIGYVLQSDHSDFDTDGTVYDSLKDAIQEAKDFLKEVADFENFDADDASVQIIKHIEVAEVRLNNPFIVNQYASSLDVKSKTIDNSEKISENTSTNGISDLSDNTEAAGFADSAQPSSAAPSNSSGSQPQAMPNYYLDWK